MSRLDICPRGSAAGTHCECRTACRTGDTASSPCTYSGEMIYIPAGSFLMGSESGGSIEMPQHPVTLRGYWISRTEVTRGEYRKFVDGGGYDAPGYWSAAGWAWLTTTRRCAPRYWAAEQDWGTGAFIQTDQHPVVGVSYYEAEAFCRWAGGRLPTEAEWEKAARWDGHPRDYPWGDKWHPARCNSWEDDNTLGGGYHARQTAPVSSYPSGASPYGLDDMAGNVWEWCSDWYSGTYYAVSPAENPRGPASGSFRILRGGSWFSSFYPPRCAYRLATSPEDAHYLYGFRIAR